MPPSDTAIHFTEVPLDPPLPVGAAAVALVDFDDDGWLDLTVAGRTVEIRRGRPGGAFGPPESLDAPSEHDPYGIAWADIDDDGDLDLFVSSYDTDRHVLWRNDDGTLVEDYASMGIQTGPGVKGVTFADLDSDGDLDLYLLRGAFFDDPDKKVNPGEQGLPNSAFENVGGGRFEDVTEAWGLAGPDGGESFVAAPFDANGDGRRDLLVVHDHTRDQLFLAPSTPGERWTDVGETFIDMETSSIMGLALGDIDGDGHLDVYGPQFAEDALLMGGDSGLSNRWGDFFQTIDPTQQTKGWGSILADVDNDGDPDPLSAASNQSVDQDPSYPFSLPGGMTAVRTDRDGGLTLHDVGPTAGILFEEHFDAWGLVAGDIDRDGALDLAIAIDGEDVASEYNVYDHSLVAFNDGTDARANGWLRIRLKQPAPNTYAVGARITVTAGGETTSQLVLAGTSFCSQGPYERHFGLGGATSARVEIEWPDGTIQVLENIAAGATTVTR